ncbi:hypothetical protein RF11_08980 [Thelohanellus kitauei]|uniref:Uncharacterized protein n=1 Tax=Thelohanellus kitauei TaxID=669202 RepID=A0A0C2MEH0_THEKT|nr:hypothetical protein RF11_08980 [Thelohanellus kitauei]
MFWIVHVCFLALRLTFGDSVRCGYTFGDPNGSGFNRMLAEKNYVMSLHGDFSHQRKPASDEIGDKVCDDIDTSLINPQRIWYSFKSETEYEYSDRLLKHECEDHRYDYEDSTAFIMRALAQCTKMAGRLATVYCRVDENEKLNVVTEVILVDKKKRRKIGKSDCNPDYSYVTPWGEEMNVHQDQYYSINLLEETFSMIEPNDPQNIPALRPEVDPRRRNTHGTR